MGDRTRGWVFRAALPATSLLAAGSWLPSALFVLLVTTVQLRWWKAPWSPDKAHVLMSLSVVLGIAYTLLFGVMAILLLLVRGNGRANDRFPSMMCNFVISALMNALIAAWSWSALFGNPSKFLSDTVVWAWVVLTLGVGVLGFRLGWSNSRAKRRALVG